MKQVLKVLGIAVGFLLSATLIILAITYFNRGKSVVTENAEGTLSLLETKTAISDIVATDGQEISGTQAISMVESLSTNNIDIPIFVFTDKKNTVSKYTKAGADTSKTGSFSNDKSIQDIPSSVTWGTGKYRMPTDNAYINPKTIYSVKCYYTSNEALEFVVILQK